MAHASGSGMLPKVVAISASDIARAIRFFVDSIVNPANRPRNGPEDASIKRASP
jgi:hypothetical protein